MLVVVTDILGQPVGPIFKGCTHQEELILEDETNWMSQNISKQIRTLHNNPEEQRPFLHCGRSQKSCIKCLIFYIYSRFKLVVIQSHVQNVKPFKFCLASVFFRKMLHATHLLQHRSKENCV
jgi:hypothetical protein